MHELAVTESILNIATKHARQSEAKRVTDVHLVIGDLSSIVDDSVQFYWDMITKNTLCENARLHFERIPAKLECRDCGHQFTIVDGLQPCPKCNSVRVKVIAGEEFLVDSLEIEK